MRSRNLILTGLASMFMTAAMPLHAQDTAAPAPATPAVRMVSAPTTAVEAENTLYLDLSNGGRVAIRLVPEWAPEHVARVKELARRGFYDGVIFHRVIDGFMAQTGDPTGTGAGGSELPDLKAEFNTMPHVRGTVSMARTNNPDTANSQFFIIFYPYFSLDRKYTNFGRVMSGMEHVDAIQRGEPPAKGTATVVLQASLASDGKPQRMPSAQPLDAPISIDALNAPISR